MYHTMRRNAPDVKEKKEKKRIAGEAHNIRYWRDEYLHTNEVDYVREVLTVLFIYLFIFLLSRNERCLKDFLLR